MLGLTGLRMDRSVLWKTVDIAGLKEACALWIVHEEVEKGACDIGALVDPAFTTSTSLRSAEVRGHDCVALPSAELC